MYTAARVEANTFALEKATLHGVVGRARADCTLRVHDALPRNRGARRQRVECVTYEAGLAREMNKARHLTIGSDAASRDSRHHLMDA